MPREKPVAAVATANNEVVAPTVAEEVKKEVFKIVATFKIRTKEGDRVSYKFVGEGEEIVKALELTAEDPEELKGQPLGTGLNHLVTVKLTVGDYTHTRNLAPHVFRSIFDEKNYKLFLKLMLTTELFNKYVSA